MNGDLFEAAKLELEKNGEFSNMTKGVSMYPMLVSGRDIITVKPARFPLKKNEVILYRTAGKRELVLHRVIKPLGGGEYLVRGDNTYINERVSEKDIAGALSSFYRNGRYHDCRTDRGYRAYVAFTRLCYPVRYFYARVIKRGGHFILRRVLKIKKKK